MEMVRTQAQRRRGEPSASFRLLAACCRWPTDAAAVRAAAAEPGVDWPYVARLAHRHRVNGFLWRGLNAAQIEVPASLGDARRHIAMGNLRLQAEAVRVSKCLDDAGIVHAFLKGAVVAELAFGVHDVKQMIDNDLLVAPADAPAALTALEAAGYDMIDPPRPSDHRLGLLFKFGRECQLVNGRNGSVLDMHWQLHVHSHLLPEPDLARERQFVMVGDRPVPAMLGDQMLLHLVLHGARHRWSRLKWLADFNALLVGMSESEVASLRASARRYRVSAALDSTMAMCARRFGTPVPDDVLRTRRARGLVALSDRLVFGKDELADQQDMPRRFMIVGTTSAFLFKMSPLYWAGAIRDMLIAPRDVLAAPLPRPLHPLYLIVAPAVRLGNSMRKAVAGKAAPSPKPTAARES